MLVNYKKLKSIYFFFEYIFFSNIVSAMIFALFYLIFFMLYQICSLFEEEEKVVWERGSSKKHFGKNRSIGTGSNTYTRANIDVALSVCLCVRVFVCVWVRLELQFPFIISYECRWFTLAQKHTLSYFLYVSKVESFVTFVKCTLWNPFTRVCR